MPRVLWIRCLLHPIPLTIGFPIGDDNGVALLAPTLSLLFGMVLALLNGLVLLLCGLSRGGPLEERWGVAVIVLGGPLIILLVAALVVQNIAIFFMSCTCNLTLVQGNGR